MTARAWLQQTAHAVYRVLSSHSLGYWLLLAWLALLLVWVLPFTLTGQAEETVAAIALDWLPIKFVYWALGVATVGCTVNRALRDWRRCRSLGVPKRTSVLEGGLWLPGETTSNARDTLESCGFIVSAESDSGAFRAVRGRFGPLWGSLFHVSLLLLAVAFVVNLATMRTSGIELIEGQTASDFLQSVPDTPERSLFRDKLATLELESVTPRFFDQYLLFERLDAQVTYLGRSRRMSLSQPLWLDAVSYMSIQDFNYAPHVVLTSSDGRTLDDAISSLKLFPPGAQDTLSLPIGKVSLALEVFPDHAVIDGVDASRTYNLANPRVRATVFEEVSGATTQRVLGRQLIAPGEEIVIPDGTRIRLEEIRYVGTFGLTYAPAAPFVAILAILVLLGLGGRLFRPRLDVIGRGDDDGVWVDARMDVLGPLAGRRELERIFASTRGSR